MPPPRSLPPHLQHPQLTTAVPPSRALELLQSYLAASTKAPHLHPDSTFTPSGLKYPLASGAAGGIVLHNLRRVEAGLRGEHLEPDPPKEREYATVGRGERDDVVLDVLIEETEKGMRQEGGADEDGEGWEDMEAFRREQEVTEGEIGMRDNGVDGGEQPEVQVVSTQMEVDGQVRENGEVRGGVVDKEARKRAKKEREKAMKREKEEARKRAKLG